MTGYPFAIIVNYDFEIKTWVACVGPYATQAKTLRELMISVHDMLAALVATSKDTALPTLPLLELELEVFVREVAGNVKE